MPHLADDQLLAESVFAEKKIDTCSQSKFDGCSNSAFTWESVEIKKYMRTWC